MIWLLILITLTFSVARFIVPVTGQVNPRDVYKDLAHIWAGILFGVAGLLLLVLHGVVDPLTLAENFGVIVWLPIAFTAVEVVAFVFRRASWGYQLHPCVEDVSNRYRPYLTVEAMQLRPDTEDAVFDFIGWDNGVHSCGTRANPELRFWNLQFDQDQKEERVVAAGHWVVKHPSGILSVWTPDQFTSTYEKVA